MITKKEGAEDQCPSCKQTLVCREITYKDTKKLQWQYKDKEVAHFSYDFKTGKSACKESTQGSSETARQSFEPDKLDISEIILDEKQKAQIFEGAEDGARRCLVILRAVQEECRKAGVTHPATVGMIFNQVCENRR